jgi:hypothetical protein
MKRLRKYYVFLLMFVVLGVFCYTAIRRNVIEYLLTKNSKEVKAIIINERNYLGNSPVSQEYAYSYEFMLNGKEYMGNSFDPKFKPNDTIKVKYVTFWPSINKPAKNN